MTDPALPRRLSCGCCVAGCLCITHAPTEMVCEAHRAAEEAAADRACDEPIERMRRQRGVVVTDWD